MRKSSFDQRGCGKFQKILHSRKYVSREEEL
jgi:hypothetical protein